MASKIKNLKGLEKELTISFDSKEIEPTIEAKLLNLSKTLDLKGFRKGKVPMNVVKGKYYEQCFNESLSEHIEQNYIKVVLDEKLNPASTPKISMDETKNKDSFTFKALIEVMPDIELKNIDKIKLEKPVLKIKKEDLKKAVDKIADQYKEWSVVDRKSKTGDRVKEYIPKIYDDKNIDEIVYVKQKEAENMTRELAKKEGIFSGPSSGGTTLVALEVAKKANNAIIVSIICDRGDRYISTGIFNK